MQIIKGLIGLLVLFWLYQVNFGGENSIDPEVAAQARQSRLEREARRERAQEEARQAEARRAAEERSREEADARRMGVSFSVYSSGRDKSAFLWRQCRDALVESARYGGTADWGGDYSWSITANRDLRITARDVTITNAFNAKRRVAYTCWMNLGNERVYGPVIID